MAGREQSVIQSTNSAECERLADLRGQPNALALLSTSSDDVSTSEAESIVRRNYELVVEAKALSSERDLNFLLVNSEGCHYVLKLFNGAQDAAVADFQTCALQHVASVDPTLNVPRVVPTCEGQPGFAYHAEGRTRAARLVTFLQGSPAASLDPTRARAKSLGLIAARLDRALFGFAHPAAGHDLLWDLKQAGQVVEFAAQLENEALRGLCLRALETYEDKVAGRLAGARAQVIHNDLNPHNILVDSADTDRISGIIDFGDMVHSTLVNEVAIAAAYLSAGGGDVVGRMGGFVAAYNSVIPLEREEIAVLPDLIATRYAMTLAITGWRAKRHPENGIYIVRNQASAMAGPRRSCGRRLPPALRGTSWLRAAGDDA